MERAHILPRARSRRKATGAIRELLALLPAEAVRIVKEAIAADEWSRRIGAIREAKRLLFEKFNFWAQVIALVEAEAGQPLSAGDATGPGVVHPRKWVRRHSLSAKLEDGWFHARQYLSGAGLWKRMS